MAAGPSEVGDCEVPGLMGPWVGAMLVCSWMLDPAGGALVEVRGAAVRETGDSVAGPAVLAGGAPHMQTPQPGGVVGGAGVVAAGVAPGTVVGTGPGIVVGAELVEGGAGVVVRGPSRCGTSPVVAVVGAAVDVTGSDTGVVTEGGGAGVVLLGGGGVVTAVSRNGIDPVGLGVVDFGPAVVDLVSR